jgi:hypothetical protein
MRTRRSPSRGPGWAVQRAVPSEGPSLREPPGPGPGDAAAGLAAAGSARRLAVETQPVVESPEQTRGRDQQRAASASTHRALQHPQTWKSFSIQCHPHTWKSLQRASASTHLEKFASLHARHGQHQPYLKGAAMLTLGLLLRKVHPPLPLGWDARFSFQSLRSRQDKGRLPCQECNRRNFKQRRAFLHPVLHFLSRSKKVDSTAIPRVLCQATLLKQQISYSIVDVWVVLVAQRVLPDGHFFQQRLEARKLAPLSYFLRGKINASKLVILSFPSVQATASG